MPAEELCEPDYAGRCAELGGAGNAGFRCVPSASRRSNIQQCLQALFSEWREVDYIRPIRWVFTARVQSEKSCEPCGIA